MHHSAEEALKELDNYFQMKPGSIADPDTCLGAKVKQVQLDNGVWCWDMISAKYVQ